MRTRTSNRLAASFAALAATLTIAASASAEPIPLSVRSSFRVGNGGVICSAQTVLIDPRLGGMFDRAYRLSCRDATAAVGNLIAVRRPIVLESEAWGLTGPDRAKLGLDCVAPVTEAIAGLGQARSLTCRDRDSGVDYRRYLYHVGVTDYLVEGLAGYDPALRLALASIVADHAVPGEIHVATTQAGDAAGFARVQAGQLDFTNARTEAYYRNNGGNFAESAAFFDVLSDRETAQSTRAAETLANLGLQQSNLGNAAAAERYFTRATATLAHRDGVAQRLIRNYRAIHALNQGDLPGALAALAAPVIPIGQFSDEGGLREGLIAIPVAEQINRENAGLRRIGGIDAKLTPEERATLLDAQAAALRGVTLRRQDQSGEAEGMLSSALTTLDSVRDGRVASIAWLRAEIGIERAFIAEAQNRRADAAGHFDGAIGVLERGYPHSPALLSAQARKAAFLARGGDVDAARALFAQVIAISESTPDSGVVLAPLLAPYFALLSGNGASGAEAGDAAAMLRAAQVLQRPGVAQTQAVLARGLSEGNDEAAALFRLSLARTRGIARSEGEIAELAAVAAPTPAQVLSLAAARSSLAELAREQTALQAQLSAFPRYRVLAPQTVGLPELQHALHAGEAYYKLSVVGDEAFALFVTPDSARGWQIEGGLAALAGDVRTVRDSIVRIENGKRVTYPFDLDKARALYLKLFGPVDAAVQSAHHVIVEPDGPLLELPAAVLITADRGIADYHQRMQSPDGDPFDLTGIAWLGRGHELSVAVSPRGFIDIRNLAPSRAPRTYLGLGENAVPSARPVTAVATDCDWPLATWQHPISADELTFAKSRLDPQGGGLLTGAAFTDVALDSGAVQGAALDQYRVLHFATHGLVTAPRPECPARPALVTSFGGTGSDGLLSFREIFDLKLDADVVILSACDTAGMATIGASREAGVTTGGNFALDGLVRAFVGAGARSVIASHWPVPDEYDATKKLIGGLINAPAGASMGDALAGAERTLMDDPLTSHPFYWAAFIILGDGAKPLVGGGPGIPVAAN